MSSIINSSTITSLFIFLILLIPIIYWKKIPKSRLSNICTTLGILGTFCGILYCLWNFDPNNIEDSVPNLLGGLQTAFLTSVFGIATGLLVKNIKSKGDESDGNIAEALANGIISLNSKNDEINKTLDNISKGLFNNDKDSSILTQLQKIRSVNSDGLNDLKKSFNEFAEKVVADNTQSLIDALTGVMKDFNTKINEQFGENFKELNSAVKELLIWQENYKNHVEALQDNFKKISDNLSGIDNTMEGLSKNHEIILDSNKELKDIITDFSSGIESFASLGEKASNSLPQIENNLNSITKGLESSYNEFANNQNQIQENMKVNIENMISQNAERIKTLDENLGLELEKSLESLGSSLATLSNKFVEDYSPLTDRLRQLINDLNKNS